MSEKRKAAAAASGKLGSELPGTSEGLQGTPEHVRGDSSWIRKALHSPRAIIGVVGVVLVIILAFAGPLFAQYSSTQIVGRPYQTPSGEFILGTDVLGRDVMSILLRGGSMFMVEGFLAALFGVGIGAIIGMIIGLVPTLPRSVLLFFNDTVMVIPQILIVLIIVSAFAVTPLTLIVAVAIAQVPYAARVVQAATRRVVNEDYYIAARMAGQSRWSLMIHEILPNIAGPVLVEFGVRLCISFVVLASLSYLGFGAGGGDWGQMIHENQGGISIQPYAVLAPICCIAVFLICMNMIRDVVSRSIGGK